MMTGLSTRLLDSIPDSSKRLLSFPKRPEVLSGAARLLFSGYKLLLTQSSSSLGEKVTTSASVEVTNA